MTASLPCEMFLDLVHRTVRTVGFSAVIWKENRNRVIHTTLDRSSSRTLFPATEVLQAVLVTDTESRRPNADGFIGGDSVHSRRTETRHDE